MKKLRRPILIVLLIVGCAPIEYKNGSTVIRTAKRVLLPKDSIKLIGYEGSIEYHSPESQLKELEKNAKIELWTTVELNIRKEQIYVGGYILVKTAGITIESAKLDSWDCKIVKLNGIEIDSRILKDPYSVPYFGSGNSWWDLFFIYINEPMNEPFKVYLIDKLSHKRTEYTVFPNEKVTKMSKL